MRILQTLALVCGYWASKQQRKDFNKTRAAGGAGVGCFANFHNS